MGTIHQAARSRYSRLRLASLIVLAVVLALVSYDVYAWWGLTAKRQEISKLSAEGAFMRVEDNGQLSQGAGEPSPEQLPDDSTAPPESEEASDMDLLMKVAGDSQVEVVSLLRSESGDGIANAPTYRLRLRGDMQRLIVFLRALEDSGQHDVVIGRLAAKRQGTVWDADLEVTSSLRSSGLATGGGSR